jgi:hypothetical protein
LGVVEDDYFELFVDNTLEVFGSRNDMKGQLTRAIRERGGRLVGIEGQYTKGCRQLIKQLRYVYSMPFTRFTLTQPPEMESSVTKPVGSCNLIIWMQWTLILSKRKTLQGHLQKRKSSL